MGRKCRVSLNILARSELSLAEEEGGSCCDDETDEE
jgi:hypothetical protein